MSFEQAIGTQDAILATEIFETLGLSMEDIHFPGQHMKLQEITDFISQFEDGMTMVRVAMMKKPTEIASIDHIHTYVNLQKKRMGLKDQLKQLEEEISLYE